MHPTYLRVKNWERFQHYKDRRPPWIKFHVELLDDYELTNMEYATQLVYDRLLLLAARTDNNIPNDPEHIGRQTNIDAVTVGHALETLLDAGFLLVAERKRSASKAIARRKRVAKSEAEADSREEAEKEAEADPDPPADLFVIPASADLQIEIDKLLSLSGRDANSATVVAVYARRLPLAVVADIRQRAQQGNKGIGWAINAMKRELGEAA